MEKWEILRQVFYHAKNVKYIQQTIQCILRSQYPYTQVHTNILHDLHAPMEDILQTHLPYYDRYAIVDLVKMMNQKVIDHVLPELLDDAKTHQHYLEQLDLGTPIMNHPISQRKLVGRRQTTCLNSYLF